MREAAVAASETADATGAIKLHASHVVMSADNALTWAAQVREAVVQIGQTASVGDIGAQVETINRFSNLLLNGEDGNGDGEVNISDGSFILNFLFLGASAPPDWVDSNADGRKDPTCVEAAQGADCAASHAACSG